MYLGVNPRANTPSYIARLSAQNVVSLIATGLPRLPIGLLVVVDRHQSVVERGFEKAFLNMPLTTTPISAATESGHSDKLNRRHDSRAVMRWIIAVFYVAAGVAHLAVPEKLLSITPSWVPFAHQVIFLTGIFEFIASVSLITRPLRFWAGIAMAAYAICVWPANFVHAINGIGLPYITNSWFYHGPRLALQPVIVGGLSIAPT
jgi:uncharacterized membrane protein